MAFMDIASQYAGQRLGQIQDRFDQGIGLLTGDEDAYRRQMGLETAEERRRREQREAAQRQQQLIAQATAQPADAANTVVSSTKVDTYGDGSQTETVKTERPAPGPIQPEQQFPQFAQAPQATVQDAVPMQRDTQITPDRGPVQQLPTQQVMPQAQAAPPRAPGPIVYNQPQAQAPAAAPQAAPAAPAAPVQAPVQPEQMMGAGAPAPQLRMTAPAPQVTPAAPVAAPAAPVAAPAPQALPTPAAPAAPPVAIADQRPQWAVDLEAAQGDERRLMSITMNDAYPSSVRDDAKNRLREVLKRQEMERSAVQKVEAAAQGDPKAQNDLLRAIRPSKKEDATVTEGSYIKAYLYSRLGLNELARQEQEKILGRSTFEQTTIDGRNFEVERDPRTKRIIAARDNEGNAVEKPILDRLRAESQPFGAQVYGFTGGPQVITTGPEQGNEYRERTNNSTGRIERILTSGPNQGKVYTGAAGVDKTVFTQASKRDYDVISAYRQRYGTDQLAALAQARKDGAVTSTQDEQRFLALWNFGSGLPGVGAPSQLPMTGAQRMAAPTAAPAAAPTPAPAAAVTAPTAPTAPPAAPPAVSPGAGAPSLVQGQAPIPGTTPMPTFTEPYPQRGMNEPESVFKQRREAWDKRYAAHLKLVEDRLGAEQRRVGEAAGAAQAGEITGAVQARQVQGVVREIHDQLQRATGSGIGAKVDSIAGWFGVSTEGAKANAQLTVLADRILKAVPRFEGPQSDRDVQSYREAAGSLADATQPIANRLAALRTIVELNRKYYPDLDWTFTQPTASNIRIISREPVR